MKRCALALGTAILLLGSPSLRADDPDDVYVDFYSVLKDADKLSTNGTPQEARIRYQQAEVALRNLQKNHPDYNRELIKYREAYVERRLDQLSTSNKLAVAQSTAPPKEQNQAKPAAPTAKPAVPAANPPPPAANPAAPAANPPQPTQGAAPPAANPPQPAANLQPATSPPQPTANPQPH
jgi:hypothetical protein